MDNMIFSEFGVEIFKRHGKFFLRYDTGAMVVDMQEDEITEEEVRQAQKSARDAENVIIACARRRINGTLL